MVLSGKLTMKYIIRERSLKASLVECKKIFGGMKTSFTDSSTMKGQTYR